VSPAKTLSDGEQVSDRGAWNGRAGNAHQNTSSAQNSSSADEVFAFLLELGSSLLATGEAVSDLERRLLEAASAYGYPDTRVMVLPTAVALAGGPREPMTLATPKLQGSAGPPLRLDQVTEVLNLARSAANGELRATDGIEALGQVRKMPRRENSIVRALAYVVVTLGVGLIIRPSAELLPSYLVLGLLVAILREGASRVPGLTSILPVLAAGVVSAIAFGVAGRYGPEPLAALIPPLVLFLPGALLTTATVDLASNEVVTGASRFLAGLLQLALLALGIVAGAALVGVAATKVPSRPLHLLGAWAPLVGVLVFGLGTALQHSAPRRSLPWLMLVLYAAWAGQLIGAALFGALLSGFVGGLVVAPLATFIERFRSAPPALVSFLPAFWLLVPGALGLIGITQLVGDDALTGATTFGDALISIIAIALGIIVGLQGLHIVEKAFSSAHRIASS